MENLKLYNLLKHVPESAQKPIKGGRTKGMTDISPMWRIEKLTETFGPCGFGWYTEITDKRIIESPNTKEIAAFVEINLYIKYKDEWSKPIVGTGGNTFVVSESKGLYMSDECFKMAYTDAISVAAKSLGVGGEIYMGQGSKYSNQTDEVVDLSGMDIKDVASITVTFGKHKGKPLGQIYKTSHDYFEWLLENATDNKIIAACKILNDAANQNEE